MSENTSESLVIRDVTIFTPEGRVDGDCRIESGRIVEVGRVDGRAAETIRGEGRWLFPGAIDAHVHFRDPGFPHKEDWSSGSASAVAGGVTTVFDMPNTSPTTTDARRLAEKRQLADDKSICNFGLFFGATTDNTQIYDSIDGVPGLKIFMGSSTGELLVHRQEDLEGVFDAWHGRIAVHAEKQERLREREKQYRNESDPAIHSVIRDPQAAVEAVRQASELAIEYGRDLHVLHLSTAAELAVLRDARQRVAQDDEGVQLTCEVCPHHLFLDTEAYDRLGTRARVNPPLRDPEDREAMTQALIDGEIQFVATDHAPHTPEEKDRKYWEAPSGLPGVQTVLPLMLDGARRGLWSPEDVVDWLAHRQADIYGIEDRGEIRAGAHADLVLVDPEMERVVTTEEQRSRCGWTPWEGRQVRGWPVLTLVNGQIAFERDGSGPGQVVAPAGLGREVTFE